MEAVLTMISCPISVQFVADVILQYTHTHPFNGPFSGTTQVSRFQKGKNNLDFTEARDSGSGISWNICKSAPRSRQITIPAHHHSVFYRPDALPAAHQQRQSTEGFSCWHIMKITLFKLEVHGS